MKQLAIAILLVSAAVLAGCTSNNPPSTTTSTPTTSTQASTPATTSSTPTTLHADLLESGSTFVLPLAQKWATAFQGQNSGVTVTTNGGGSGKGKSDITSKLVDVAGSDSPMNDTAIAAAGGDIIHLPVAAGAVTIAYNVPDLQGQPALKFDGDTIAKIFLGQITKWNDPQLAALNPGVTLPAQDMAVVHRSDGSGTTATFTDYLSKVSPDWKSQVGSGTSVTWPCEKVQPACTAQPGNNGVGGQISKIPYSIGYLGAEWANITKVQTGVIKNTAGNFEAPTSDTVGAAVAAGVASGAFDDHLRGSVTNQACDTCYPITLVTWFLVHQHQGDLAKGQALAAFLWYVVHDGQSVNPSLSYNAIPASVVQKEETFINSMDANGAKLR